MKKIITIILMTVFCFSLIGCGKTSQQDIDEELLDTNTNESDSSNEELKLYSDGTKYVFEYANTKYVFYYSGDKITAYHTYVDYQDSKTARAIYQALKIEDYEDLDRVTQKGRYLLFEWNKNTYEDMTASELKTAYSYMKELKG